MDADLPDLLGGPVIPAPAAAPPAAAAGNGAAGPQVGERRARDEGNPRPPPPCTWGLNRLSKDEKIDPRNVANKITGPANAPLSVLQYSDGDFSTLLPCNSYSDARQAHAVALAVVFLNGAIRRSAFRPIETALRHAAEALITYLTNAGYNCASIAKASPELYDWLEACRLQDILEEP